MIEYYIIINVKHEYVLMLFNNFNIGIYVADY